MSISGDMADYYLNIAYSDISDGAIDAAKRLLIDSLGVGLGGSVTKHGQAAIKAIQWISGKQDATVINGPCKADVVNASLVNGTLIHAIDFDDAHKFVHPGCAVVPAALAMGEKMALSGKELLTALVVGYDVSIKVSLAAGIPHRKRGYHPTGTCNVFGAAAAASSLMKLGRPEFINALGIAGTQASGLTQYRYDGSNSKHFHGGKAASSGVLAALFAASGFSGPLEIFEGKFGFFSVLGGTGSAEILRSFDGFEIENVDIKPYPSCRQTHGPIDLAIQISKDYAPTPEEIESIMVEIYDYATGEWLVDTSSPQSPLEAMLNIPFCIAVALLYADVNLHHFSENSIASSKINDLAGKVKVVPNQAFSKRFPEEKKSRLKVVTRRGDVFQHEVSHPKGTKNNPLSQEDICRKFKGLAEPVIGLVGAQRMIDSVNELERSGSIQDLMEGLGGK